MISDYYVLYFRVSKSIFDDFRDKLNGRLRDLSNKEEEFEGRIKVVERKLASELKSSKQIPLMTDDK